MEVLELRWARMRGQESLLGGSKIMKQCEFCGASMADEASFCGKCGRVPSQTAHRPTRVSNMSTIGMEDAPDLDDENQTILSASGKHMVPRSPSGILRPVTLLPINED